MRIVFITIFLILSSAAFSQSIKFKISGINDTTLNLVKYIGKGMYYADTAKITKGIIEFDGKKQKSGILALFLPGEQLLEFVYNNEDIYIESTAKNPMPNAKVKKSEENTIFLSYVDYITKERNAITLLSKERDTLSKDSMRYKTLSKMIEDKNLGVIAYQKEFIKNNPTLLVSLIIGMSMDVDIPEAPVNDEGDVIDPSFRFNYFRAHYFDNVNFNDDRLVNTPIYHTKIENYFSDRMMIQNWDTVVKYAFQLCDKLPANSDMLQYTVSWITSHYEKSQIMGMDKVFVRMGQRYYCERNEKGESKAFWMPEDKLEKLCKQVDKMKGLVMGEVPKNISLPDTSDVNWRNFYSLKNEYVILYFWDPECGHCKKITPKLQELYTKKFKERDIEIFAVGKAVDDDFVKWKAFIKKHNLEFINVAMTDRLFKAAQKDASQFIPKYTTIESLNYQTTYDVFMTPKLFLLDKDKKIIAKGLDISQLEEYLDRLQGFESAEKLFPLEEQPEDEDIH